MDTISQVRLAFHVQGWSMKKISRELHVSRNTVRKIVRSNETDFSYERANQPLPRIGPWQGQLEQFLVSNSGKPSRERLTLTPPVAQGRGLHSSVDDALLLGQRLGGLDNHTFSY